MAVGVFDLLHAGHLHYLEEAKKLGQHLTVVIAHDDTVRKRKHEPVTNHDLRCRMVAGLKPVDDAMIGNPPNQPMYDILHIVQPDIIALGYDQEHAEVRIRNDLKSGDDAVIPFADLMHYLDGALNESVVRETLKAMEQANQIMVHDDDIHII